MKLYLAGPISGKPEYNEAEFRRAADYLRKEGHDVISPLEVDRALDHGLGKLEWCDYIMRGILLILHDREGIALLDGWLESRGTLIEARVGKAAGLPLFSVYGLVPVEFEDPISDEAAALVDGQRQDDYGSPDENWGRTVRLWRQIGIDADFRQALLCMIAVKVAREQHKSIDDNPRDICGYTRIIKALE